MINQVIEQYVIGHYTRQELETYLVNVGFSSQIVEINLKQADRKKAIHERPTEILRALELAKDENNSQEDDNPF